MIGLDDKACRSGFHDPEDWPGTGSRIRWTDGHGELALDGGRILELLIKETVPGWRNRASG